MRGEGSIIEKQLRKGKRVAVEGYLRLPEKLNRKIGPLLQLYPSTEFSGKPVGVSTAIGGQPNQIAYIPRNYTDKDLKMNTANGQVARFGTRVKVSGDVYFPALGQVFPCALSKPLVELAE